MSQPTDQRIPTRIRTDWHSRLVTRRTRTTTDLTTATAPVVPPLHRPATDTDRGIALRATQVAARILAEAPTPDGLDILCGRLHRPAELRVVLHRDADLSRLTAYQALYGGEVTCSTTPGGNVQHELLTEVDGVRIAAWTLLPATPAEAVA